MMSPSFSLRALIQRAAELRANGLSWESIAPQLQRTPQTLRRWPSLYRQEWQRCFAQAEDDLLAEASNESRVMLRKLLRSEDERIVLATGQALLKLRLAHREHEAKLQPSPVVDDEIARFVAELKRCNDDDLETFLSRLATDGESADSRAVGADPATGPTES